MKFFPGTCNVLFPAGEVGAPFMKILDCLFQAFSVYNIKYGCEDWVLSILPFFLLLETPENFHFK